MEQNCKLGNRHTHKYSQVIFDNEAIAIRCKKMNFSKTDARKIWTSIQKKISIKNLQFSQKKTQNELETEI